MKKIGLMLAVIVFVSAFHVGTADALPPFKKAFQVKYVDDSGDDMKAAFKSQSCNTCHVKGEKKNVNNAYGLELAKLIEGNAKMRLKDAKAAGTEDAEKATILAELTAGFTVVEGMDSPSGETYGARLAAGKLPLDPPPAE